MNDNFFKFWIIVAGLFCLAVFLNLAADMFWVAVKN